MSRVPDESEARALIGDRLSQAGWDLDDPLHVRQEVGVTSPGRADYVLYGQAGTPLAVIEAKRSAIQPYAAKQQALPYAQSLDAPFIYLANGDLIYFWDYENDDARIVEGFHSRRDLERLLHLRRHTIPLATCEIPSIYVRNGEVREVRPYQTDAMKALDHALELGKRRFLLELPTGMGKTDLICLYLKRLIEAGRVEKILFLVDRDQLAKQAVEAFQDLLSQHGTYWLKSTTAKQEQQITVALLQTMIARVDEFSTGYFDVVVMDECHRSIYGSWQAAVTHFDALHIGLTATPAPYVDRNTFDFYQCRSGEPDFSYPISAGFDAGYLSPYRFATGITEVIARGADVDDIWYDPAEFERKWTNDRTNRLMMQEFDALAWQNYLELAPGLADGPGKGIVFAITKHHAARLAQYLNELHPEYSGKYAEVITSDIADPEEMIRKFKRDALPKIAVSVGMLDTGFDCREVLHIVMCRRVRSPILYQQMRGRGARTAPHIGKRGFVIYDFFRNHEYFDDYGLEDFGTYGGRGKSSRNIEGIASPLLVELDVDDDWLQALSYIEVGPGGERLDKRDYVNRWEELVRRQIAQSLSLRKIRDGVALTPDEEAKLAHQLNRPEYFFNEDNLRNAYRNPEGNLVDFVRSALGTLKVKSREEKLDELFRAWLVPKSFTPEQAEYLTLLKGRGVSKGSIALADLFSPPLSILDAGGMGLELFGEQTLRQVVSELNNNVLQRKSA